MRPRLLLLTLFLAALGCAVPPALTPTPTRLSITPASTHLTTTPGSQTAASQPTAYIPHATLPPEPPAHRILIRHLYGLGEFYDAQTGHTFTPRGVSYQPPADQAALQDDFRRLSAAGYNTLRILIDDCSAPWGCIALPDGQGLDPAALDALVALLNQAKENNLFMLLVSADLPEGSSYAAIASQGSSESFSGARSTALLTPHGLQATRSYWSDLLAGLSARSAPFDIILGWELLAEQWFEGDQPPFSLSEGRLTGANGQSYDLSDPAQAQALALDGLRYFIAELRPVILNVDPTGLVGMGFLVPDYPNPARAGDTRYTETASLLSSTGLDFIDLHLDPGSGLTPAEHAQNFGLDARLAVPVLMSDFSASTWTYPTVESAATAIQDWIAASCSFGFDGWLYGSFAPTPGAWGFTGENSFLMEAISPRSQPDACTTTVLPGRNLALGRPVSVSAGSPTEPPEMAVDGTDAQWSAGAFAEQWLMIDLGAPYTIGSIRLLVGQWPAGQTVHQLFAAGPDGAMHLLREFSDYTRDYDLLEYIPPTPLTNIQYIRVVTLESPAWIAWREIEVLAPFRPTPTPTGTITP